MCVVHWLLYSRLSTCTCSWIRQCKYCISPCIIFIFSCNFLLLISFSLFHWLASDSNLATLLTKCSVWLCRFSMDIRRVISLEKCSGCGQYSLEYRDNLKNLAHSRMRINHSLMFFIGQSCWGTRMTCYRCHVLHFINLYYAVIYGDNNFFPPRCMEKYCIIYLSFCNFACCLCCISYTSAMLLFNLLEMFWYHLSHNLIWIIFISLQMKWFLLREMIHLACGTKTGLA